jgi:hypothetical protein
MPIIWIAGGTAELHREKNRKRFLSSVNSVCLGKKYFSV